MLFRSRIKTAASTPFSEFIRNASSAEKKRVYERVLKKASERQNRLLREFAVSGQPVPAGFAVNEAETHRTTARQAVASLEKAGLLREITGRAWGKLYLAKPIWAVMDATE